MAATLCNYIFVKPCEACGKCCDEMSKCCADACECCRPCWEYMQDFWERPFAVTLSFIFLIVFAPACALLALSGMTMGVDTAGCKPQSMPMWGMVAGINCFIDFGVGIYIFCKFNEPSEEKYSTRMTKLMCTDGVVAVYICVLIFKFVWLILGSVWSQDATLTGCPNGFGTMIDIMIIFGWVFFGVGATLIAWHYVRYMCCASCCPEETENERIARIQRRQERGRGRGHQQQHQYQANQQQRQYQANQPNVQTMSRNNGGYQQSPMPVATAQPVYQDNNQPQVVVHAPARNSAASKQPEQSTASKLFGKAKGFFK